jgi:hypothetical protein
MMPEWSGPQDIKAHRQSDDATDFGRSIRRGFAGLTDFDRHEVHDDPTHRRSGKWTDLRQ